MTQIQPHACPVCSGGKMTVIERRLNVPTLQNVTLPDRKSAQGFSRGVLTMVQCGECGFVWNAAFDPQRISYDAGYNNDVSASAFYQAHLRAMADRILAAVPPEQDIHYVEIGCGEGDFLRLLHERSKGRVKSAVGFDPSCTTPTPLPDGVTIHRCFFTPDEVSKIPPEANVICSRHTIEHVSDVQGFAANLAAAMAPGRHLFVETPDVDWILHHGAFQDFFYEHCALYNPPSIRRLLSMHGLQASVSPVYDDQYMWVEAGLKSAAATAVDAEEGLAPEEAVLGEQYLYQRNALLDRWAKFLIGRHEFGGVAIWGAASKGVTFSLLMNSRAANLIDFGIDLNPAKQGCFMPVSATPIVDPATAMAQGVATIVIMNPNYEAEIRAQIDQMGWQAEVAVLNEAEVSSAAFDLATTAKTVSQNAS